MNQSQLLTVAAMLGAAAFSKADTINWGNTFGSINLQSDATTPVTSAGFTIQLGAFTDGFVPDGSNVDLWAANWNSFSEADENMLQVAGYYTRSEQLLDNNTFVAGDQAYVWMFNSQVAVPGTQWLLYTNDATDGNLLDDWLFPNVTGSQQTMVLQWRVSNSSHVIFGATDPDGGGGGTPRIGGGIGTDPSGTFNLQTRTFIPEPSSALLGLAGAALLGRRRRRPVQ